MGKTVVWAQEDAIQNADKRVFLGKQFTGTLDARDTWRNEEGKDQMIYRILLEDGTYVSVWSTAVILSAMEKGFKGNPVPEGAIVRFTHNGMRKSQTKGRKPYHDVLVEFAIPDPTFQKAAQHEATGRLAPASDDPFAD
jgi:hypothetical protein